MNIPRRVVGVTTSIDPGRIVRSGHDYVYLKRAYSQAISKAGGHPILLTPDLIPEVVAELCDAVVISGGDDLPHDLIQQSVATSASAELLERIQWERRLIDVFAAASKPVLGVCYGMQLMNLHFGGTLVVDIPAGLHPTIDHGGAGRTTQHYIGVAVTSTLFKVLGERALVSSSHHQAVDVLAAAFTATARADDGVVEAMESDRMFAVEWHPESDQTGPAIYGHLLDLIR